MIQLDKNRDTVSILVEEIGNMTWKFLKLQESLETNLAELETLKDLPYVNEDELLARVKELDNTFNCYQKLAAHTRKLLLFYANKVTQEP